ncbi:hypothetical protein RN001_007028 [Aquatica leii]|uniref:Gustatory receptor n=1 Tax=Aquatica leii TaxID=1421715 RepID=A0AAN7SK82_9COLE|nr:hypothetical protein RN001_007028 [Aquatica leii]
MFQPKNFYSVLTPMYYSTKIVGLTPFKINQICFRRSKINLCWCIGLMIFLNLYTSAGLLQRPDIDWQFIMVITDIVAAYLTQANMACGILFGCIYSNTILEILASIDSFDKDLQKIYSKLNLLQEYRNSKIYLVFGIIATFFLLVAVIVLSFLPQVEEPAFFGEFLAYIAPEVISTSVVFQFCSILLCVKQRFVWLNKTVQSLTKMFQNDFAKFSILYQKNKVFSTPVMSQGVLQDYIITTLEKLRCKHYLLFSICKKINAAYSVQLLLIVGQVFVTIIILTYYSGRHIVLDTKIPINYIMYCFIHIILALLQITVLTVVCSTTSREAKKTGTLFFGLISKQFKNKYKEELQIGIVTFSLQLLHQDLYFTACHFFILNENLLLSMAGAITTYLVIVIQFEIKDYEKSKSA